MKPNIEIKHANPSSNNFLPGPVAEKLGIPLELQRTLVNLNDGRKLTFEQIADYLEENDNDNS